MEKEKQNPTLNFALFTVITLIAFIVICLRFFGIPVVTTLFFSWLVLVPFALKLGYSANEIEESIYTMIKMGVGLFALLLAIGCMVAVWLCAGTVPTLIYWGLKLITPGFFLVVAFLICLIVSLPTGTNWGTISTAGVAMMGIGLGLGLPAGLVAGAVVSGACVGDVLSPVSDTPLLTSTVCGVPLMRHLKHNLWIVVPSVILSALLFAILGFRYSGAAIDTSTTVGMTGALSASFHLGLITLIPMAVVIGLLVMRQSALTSIMVGSLIGIIVAVFYQGYALSEVGNFLADGFVIETGNQFLDPILNRGGISSMLGLIGMVVASLGMGGILDGTGILNKLVESLSGVIKSRVGLTGVTLVGTGVCTSLVAANYFSLIMNGTLMTPLYRQQRYRPENTSRIVNNLTDTISMMVPWSLNGTFIASTLGIPLSQMIPFMFFNLIVIALEIVCGLTGFGLSKYTEAEWNELEGQPQ